MLLFVGVVVAGRRDHLLVDVTAVEKEELRRRGRGRGKWKMRESERLGPARPGFSLIPHLHKLTQLVPTLSCTTYELRRLDMHRSLKTAGIGEVGVHTSGIWRLGFKIDDAYEFRV